MIYQRDKLKSNSKEYEAIDIWRVICAIGVIALHLEPFKNINAQVNFWVSYVLTRMCVPFFFITSGFFFFNIIDDNKKVSNYILKIIRLYIVCTILYLPFIIDNYSNSKGINRNIALFLKNFICIGSYQHLWYFVGLIFAIIMLKLIITFLNIKVKYILLLSVILYTIGVFLNIFNSSLNDIVVFKYYYKIFGTTRNGLFLGFPYVFLGYYIRKRTIQLEDKNRKKYVIWILLFLISFIIMNIEATLIHHFYNSITWDMLIFLMPTSAFLFLVILNYKWHTFIVFKIDFKKLRKITLIIFELHLLIAYIIKDMLSNLLNTRNVNNLLLFIIVSVVTIIVSEIIVCLGNKVKILQLFY